MPNANGMEEIAATTSDGQRDIHGGGFAMKTMVSKVVVARTPKRMKCAETRQVLYGAGVIGIAINLWSYLDAEKHADCAEIKLHGGLSNQENYNLNKQ